MDRQPVDRSYRQSVTRRLQELSRILTRAAVGDFSRVITPPKREDEFTQLYVGLNLLVDSMREKISELEEVNQALAANLQQTELTKEQISREKAVDDATLASIGEGIVVIDTNKNVLFMNRGAEQVLGWPIEDVAGKNWDNIVDSHDPQGRPLTRDQWPLQTVLTKKQRLIDARYTYRRQDGALVPVSVTATPVELDGRVIGAVGVFRDISKELELDRAKGEVISFTSHQLRTPLSVINWYSEKLLDGDLGPLNEKQKDYLRAIYTTAQKTIGLVNTFLNVSRAQLGTLPVTMEPTNIDEIINDVLDEIRPRLEAKRIALEATEIDSPLSALTDQKLIRIVFQNLFNNAAKYTPEQGKITYKIVKKNNEQVLVEVSDTGYGIPKSQQAHIFSKLFRADNIQEVDTEGAGLGLYMVRLILKQVKGEISFRSRLNRGTTFFIELPLALERFPNPKRKVQ